MPNICIFSRILARTFNFWYLLVKQKSFQLILVIQSLSALSKNSILTLCCAMARRFSNAWFKLVRNAEKDDPFAFVVVILAVVGVAVVVVQISTTKTKNSFTIFSPDSIVPSMFKSLQSSETTNRCDSFFFMGFLNLTLTWQRLRIGGFPTRAIVQFKYFLCNNWL